MMKYALRIILLALLLAIDAIASTTMIGGEAVKPGEHPAVFGLKINGSESEAACTAFLVAPQLLVTAAHCLKSIDSIALVANGTDLNRGSTQETRVSPAKFAANPIFVTSHSGMSTAERNKNAASDIGYIILKNPVAIAPLSIYMTTDEASMKALYRLEVTLVGYGAVKFLGTNGDYGSSKTLVKHFGSKTITEVRPGFLWMAGEKNGALPGDSGGPEMATINGEVKVFGLNHAMQGKTVTTTRVIRRGPRKGETETTTQVDPKQYGYTIGTMLTQANLCWVMKDSKQKIPGIECPSAE